MMSKINSPSSNNSGTSSETSETQSIESITRSSPTTVNSSSRTSKGWKRMKENNNDKDAENKRPPWRAVSVSTLPKPDKNALLRAKLLDASRRLRAGKASVSIQTDIVPTKLMKEVNLGAQPDLILYKEMGILTDGSYTKKKEGTDEFILTYSVSQITDAVAVANAATQTLLPKVHGDDFIKAYYSGHRHHPNVVNSSIFSETEQKLLQQIHKIREYNKLQQISATDAVAVACDDNTITSEGSHTEETSTDTGATTVQFRQNQKSCSSSNNNTVALSTEVVNPYRPSLLLQPTMSAWHFEYDNNNPESDNKTNFQPYALYPSKSWNNFASTSKHLNREYIFGNQHFDWNLFLLAIDELIQESHRLVDIIEDLKFKQGECNKFSSGVPPFKMDKLVLPSEHWLPIIEQQEKDLSEMLNNLNPNLEKRKLQKFDI